MPITRDSGEANGAVEPLLFCLCRACLSTSLLEGASYTSVKPHRPAPTTRLSRVMSKRSPPTVMGASDGAELPAKWAVLQEEGVLSDEEFANHNAMMLA